MRHDSAYLQDILYAAKNAIQFAEGLSREEFLASGLHQSAVIRQLEIIGEASKKVSPKTKAAYPEIHWKKMAGLRDVLIHAYNLVDIRMVWKLINEDAPLLIEELEQLIPDVNKEKGTAT